MTSTDQRMERLRKLSPAKRDLLLKAMQREARREEASAQIARRPQGTPAPLSFAQQRLWFIDQLTPGTPLYNIPAVVRMRGALDLDALERGVAEVVRRHEALRTSFGASDAQPAQFVAESADTRVPVTDLRGIADAAAREQEAGRLAALETLRPFDLATGPLWRTALFRLADEDHVMALTMHHIISDGWSMSVLIKEVATLYRAYASGRPSPLPEPLIQYADFAHWQREWLTGEVLDGQLGYWKRQLADAPPALELPSSRPRPALQTHRGATFNLAVPNATCEALKALGRREGATLFATLLAAFQTLLYRYTGQTDITVGTPVAGRTRAETEGLIGLFINTLVMRGRLAGDPTFRELLGRVRETVLEAHAHQDVPFEKLVEEVQPRRDMSHTPLFQVMFILQNTPPAELALPGLQLSQMKVASETAKFDLTLMMSEQGGDLTASFEYNTDLFDAASIARLGGHFRRLLEAIAADADQRLSALPLLSEEERHQLVFEWNDTAADYPRDKTVHELFEEQAAATPDGTALVFGEESLTYAELNERAERLARRLRALGCGRETLVGVCLERSAEMVVALLGVLKAGAAYLPLDPTYPRDRLAFMLEDAAAHALVVSDRTRGLVPFGGALVSLGEDAHDASRDDEGRRQQDEQPLDGRAREASATPDNLAYVIHTSGSTGRPKGVAVPHRAVVNFLNSMRREPGLAAGDVLVAVTSLSFDIAALEIFLPLSVGARVVVASREEAADADALRELLRRVGATAMQATPVTWRMLLESGWTGGGGRGLKVLCGGEALQRDLAAALTGADVAGVWNLYGPTETTIWSSVERLAVPFHETRVSTGRPIDNTRIHVLDAALAPVPVGVPGELYIAGDGLARGYLNRAALTAERFVPDPFGRAGGGRMYRTGDLARRLEDGRIEVIGRTDQQVKVRGYRIELGEIEAALSACEGVRQAVAVVREDAPGDKRIVAYMLAEESEGPRPAALRRALQERLPEYMIPSAFVVLDEMPLTANGKIDRRALPAPGDAAREDASPDSAAPRTPTEEVLAGIFAEVLGVSKVGAAANFFELGGHSLLATKVVSRVRKTFGVEIPLRAIFESPTVAALASAVERAAAGGTEGQPPPLVPAPRGGELPLSFAQQRLWFIDQLVPDQPLYHVPGALRLRGPLDASALARAVNEIISRHEILRTTFAAIEGRAVQVVAPSLELPLPVFSLEESPEGERETELRRLADAAARRPFDLTRGPLLRTALVRLGEEDHVLLFTLHHIISDGWSIGVMTGEMVALYNAFAAGRPSPLAPLPVQYADYAVWQRGWLRGEVLEEQLSYWRARLGRLPALELPLDRPRPHARDHRGGREFVELPAALSDELRALGRREGATLFMVLLAAFKTLLHRTTGQRDIVVGTDIANRHRAEVENLIGFFVNQLVLRTDLAGDPTFRELLARVREVTLGAYAHQDLPFEQLVQALEPERELGRSPLFQAKLVLQNAPRAAGTLSGLSVSTMEPDFGTAPFDFLFALVDRPDSIGGMLWYSAELFDAETVRRLLRRFRTLLESIAADPGQRLSGLRLLGEEESGGLAPEDFPDAELSVSDFENLLLSLGGADA
jgi:amino acid adenylation domain-containing protein